MKLSTKGRYGTRLMLELAKNYGTNKPILLREIAEKQEISLKYLEQIVMPLKNSKLVRAVRGAKGGYMLAKSPESITLFEIIQALEGDVDITECLKYPEICNKSEFCVARELWGTVSIKIKDVLGSLTLNELINKEKGALNEI